MQGFGLESLLKKTKTRKRGKSDISRPLRKRLLATIDNDEGHEGGQTQRRMDDIVTYEKILVLRKSMLKY